MMNIDLSLNPEIQDNQATGGAVPPDNRKDNWMSIAEKMTTAELLKYYNDHSGKPPVKRFSDRKSAERRVNDLITGEKETAEVAKTPKKKAEPKKTSITGVVYNGETFKSLPIAFLKLKLPMGRMIKARITLKAEGKLVFEHDGKTYNFKIAA